MRKGRKTAPPKTGSDRAGQRDGLCDGYQQGQCRLADCKHKHECRKCHRRGHGPEVRRGEKERLRSPDRRRDERRDDKREADSGRRPRREDPRNAAARLIKTRTSGVGGWEDERGQTARRLTQRLFPSRMFPRTSSQCFQKDPLHRMCVCPGQAVTQTAY